MGVTRYFRSSTLLWISSLATLGAFVASSYYLQDSLEKLTPATQAASTPTTSDRRVNLATGWSYAPETGSRAPGDLPSAPDTGWLPFDPARNWASTQGFHFSSSAAAPTNERVWLKNEFQIQYPIQNPAIVLGHVPGTYRIFLNGHVIGEFDENETVAYAPFDAADFALNATNQILLSVRETSADYHGFATAPEIGSFIGEFNDVRKTVGLGIAKPSLSNVTFFAIACGALAMALMYSLSRALMGASTQAHGRAASSGPAVHVAADAPGPTAPAVPTEATVSSPVQKELVEIHKKIAALVKSARSTLYVTVYSGKEPAWFEAVSIVGDGTLIRKTRPISDELLGTACQAGKPWLIRDIGDVLKMGSRAEYQTRSCIIIPLMGGPLMTNTRSGGNPRILGALTLADKDNSVAFTEADMALAVEACAQVIQLLDAYPIIRSRLA
jgi:hypothetical protein